MHYLQGTRRVGFFYTAGESGRIKITAFSDADWAGDLINRRSTTGTLLLETATLSRSHRGSKSVSLGQVRRPFIAADKAI